MMLRVSTKLTAFALLAVLAAMVSAPQADAWPFKKKEDPAEAAVKKIQTAQPPPLEAMTERCEPLRQKVARIHRSNAVYRLLMSPRLDILTQRHERCKENLMSQEFNYLKQVDIEQPPSLPKLQVSAPAAPSSSATDGSGQK